MPGKSYTMREMKQIVEYLVEHKAYAEIRGRKMWMDLARSQILNRTWQSLKETFIKRILPDIHNPYYKLSVEQISSFRQEHDVEARYDRKKLDVYTISDSSSTDNQRGKEKAELKNKVENTGEDKCSKIQNRTRSSTETLVLENCYETAEDLQRDLESPKHAEKSPQKSIRDFITYSEPLTPMLQEVLHDFSTDDEEPQLQIAEEPEVLPNTEENVISKNVTSVDSIRESQSYNKNPKPANDKESEKIKQTSKIKSLKLKKTHKGTWENKEAVEPATSKVQEKEANNNELKNVYTCDKPNQNVTDIKEKSVNSNVDQTNNTNSTIDTQLPNNPEGLGKGNNEKRTSTESTHSEHSELSKKDKKNKCNKRTRSLSSTERKKKKKDKDREVSELKETQTYESHPHAADLQKAFGDSQENIQTTQETNNLIVNGIGKNDTAQKSSPAKKTEAKEHTSPKTNNEGTLQEEGPSGVNDVSVNAADINPCLKSVSLFAEQFSQSKYSDSDNEDVTQIKNTEGQLESNDKNREGNADNKQNKDEHKENSAPVSREPNICNSLDKTHKPLGTNLCVDNVLLKSHSESESESFQHPKKRNGRVEKSRETALANAFGFSSGAVSNRIKNNKRFSHRNRLPSRNVVSNIESGSSDEYTTASDSDDAPVPRARNGGHSLKYMKPQSYDFLSNNEGGLYVVGRKKIYPLLLKENGALHYACAGESYADEEHETYWKTKFLEERKKCAEEKIRADELSRLLQQAESQKKRAESKEAPTSPILQANLSNTTEKNNSKQKKEPVNSERDKKAEETVKIKFTKNHEIELEGQWPHVNPLLERMVEILKSKETQEQSASKNPGFQPIIQEDPSETEDKEVTDKQVQGEKIYKQTKSKSMPKEVKEKAPEKVNVKRKRGSKNVDETEKPEEVVTVSSGKSTPVVTASLDPEVHKKVTEIESEIFKKIEEIEQTDEPVVKETASDVNVTTRRRGRSKKSPSPKPGTSRESAPKKLKISTKGPKTKASASDMENDATSVSFKRPSRAPRRYESDTGLVVQGKAKQAKSNISVTSKSDTSIPEDDPNIRYKLPPQSGTRKIVNKANYNKSYSTRKPRLFTSPDNISINSESTQGYQDSDISPPNSVPRRKRRVSLGFLSKKGQLRKVKRRSSPYLADDDSNETNELPHKKSGSMPNLSVNSEVYRSESYQLLLPKMKNFSQLDKIDESPLQNEVIENHHHFTNLTPITINVNNEFYIPSDELRNDSIRQRSSENSSNISFPLSPVLSIAGNLSVSKEMISSSLEDHPTLNEIHQGDIKPGTNLNKYLMSDIDVSVPLMEQDCEFQSRQIRKTGPCKRKSTISESLPSKIDAAKVEEQSSDSLDQKLRDLLLESAKKIAQSQTDNPIDTANVMEVDPPTENKTRPKKRCSTPRKKQTAIKFKSSNVEPVLEEHTESCSFSGRKSCPPIINILPSEELVPLSEKADANRSNITKTNKEKKKKDVIKVKILRPRDKSVTRKGSNSRLSVCTDSGINDTASVLSDDCRCCNESTELIHNHSDTCLHMDECIADSVELIENLAKSVISLNSNSIPSEISFKCMKLSSEEYVTPELFCTDARDATSLSDVTRSNTQSTNTDGATVYHTPLSEKSFNSLVTDDLSDELPPQPPTKWYLFGEDTNFADARSQDSNTGGVGSNLKQIFPITCAIPDLSTITEMSKENDSMKPNLNTDNEIDSLSKSIFDSDF